MATPPPRSDSGSSSEDEVVEIPAGATSNSNLYNSSMQLQTVDDTQSAQTRFASRIQGSRRQEDDSGIAFGERFAEKFGGPGTMPMPSAPPPMDEYGEAPPPYEEEQAQWARASVHERRSLARHEFFQDFFMRNGMDSRAYNPYMNIDELPCDAQSQTFRHGIAQARLRLNAAPQNTDYTPSKDVTRAAFDSILRGIPAPKKFAEVGDVYLPPALLAQHDLDNDVAIAALQENDQFDQVQLLANEAANIYKSSWIFGKRIAGGTLEIRMNAERSKMIVLGEGYKSLNLGGAEGWATVAKGIPRDTEYYHLPSEFTIVRIQPGHIGLCQQTGTRREIMRLLPGRYVLPERYLRFIGQAVLTPNTNVSFTPHAHTTDSDIAALARRYSSYYLTQGRRLFVSGRDGVFPLEADDMQRPFIFDSNAMEVAQNTVNKRDFVQASDDGRYHIVRLQAGQRVVVRDTEGNDVVVEYEEQKETFHFSDLYFDFSGEVYSRQDKVARHENITSIRLTPNDVLVLADADGNVRFVDKFNPQQSITLRPPWRYVDTIAKTQNEYVLTDGSLTVARVKPASNQWPIIYNVAAGEVQILPHSVEYVLSSSDEQVYIGMANRNDKDAQNFDVPGVGMVTVANVTSGQLAMCRLNNMSFFLPPLPEPYVFRPPNEFFGMVNMEDTHVHVPGSDLHRIYVPSGQWAVAMVDGRQVILDPANADNSTTAAGECQGNGIWIFRAQQLELGGPCAIDEKKSELFNVVRLQVPMNEIAFGVDSHTGDRIIWPSGNHVINKNAGQVFQGFFNTQLDDVKISQFNVVWNGGVKSTVDASVGFHIMLSDGVESDGTQQTNVDIMKRVLNLCQNHEDLHAKVVENTKHQLFDVIAMIEPLGYGSSLADNDDTYGDAIEGGRGSTRGKKETTLQDLEKIFSEHVDSILRKYGIVVDNVTITKIDLDTSFIERSEEVQKARMDARKKVLVAEQDMKRNQIAQQQALQDQQSKTRSAEETSKQRDIERKREVDDVAAAAEADARAEANRKRVEYEAELERQEAEGASRVKQQELRILELTQTQKATEVEMETRKRTALLEAETRAIEASAMAKAEARARLDVAETALQATRFEVEAKKLAAEAEKAMGLAKTAVQLNQEFGGVEQNSDLLLQLLKMRAAVDGQRAIAEATARCTDPAISRMMGQLETFQNVVPQICQQNSQAWAAGQSYFAMPASATVARGGAVSDTAE